MDALSTIKNRQGEFTLVSMLILRVTVSECILHCGEQYDRDVTFEECAACCQDNLVSSDQLIIRGDEGEVVEQS